MGGPLVSKFEISPENDGMPIRFGQGFDEAQLRLALIAVALVIMAVWVIPWTAPLLEQIDEIVFYSLNGSLTWGHYWQMYWAFANHRAFDVTMALVYCGCFALYCFHRTDKETAGRRFAELATLMITLLLARAAIGVFYEAIGYRRSSPTRVLEPVVLLSEVFDGWKIKDGSSNSYPGDHALVSLYLCLYFVTRSTRQYAALFLGIAIIAILPRLVGGAHWVTDVIAGSFFFAVIAWAVVEGSGLFEWSSRKIAVITDRLVHPIHGFLQRRIGSGPTQVS